MKLRMVISGGQTGADRTGLECAKTLGLETGGFAPRGYKTEIGNDPTLKGFGLLETAASDYPPRTRMNVQNSDVTLWFGRVGSPGFWCTKGACEIYSKPFVIVTPETDIQDLANRYEIWNVAGNRVSKNPHVVKQVQDAFEKLGKL